MLIKEKMDRINALAKKSKNEGLTEEEKAEQKILREEYLVKFREHFKGHLESIEFVEDIEDDNRKKNKN
ncbi:MAG: DUF896 domain-containing protein [Peptostreptococcaceae bacterium]|nr:DUF896 domain-containing protein [Peptostreptococcaceae bacterium]